MEPAYFVKRSSVCRNQTFYETLIAYGQALTYSTCISNLQSEL